MLLYGLIFSIVIHVDYVEAQNAGERCLSPERTIGQCMDIRQCPKLLKLLEGPRPLPTETVSYLRKAQCGFQGRDPLVCCAGEPPKPTSVTPNNTPKPLTGESGGGQDLEGNPIDVSQHPKLKVLPKFCGPATENKITGGNLTELYEYPWMALLGYTTFDSDEIQYRCGGSLITERYILTAAHCVTNLNNLELMEVRLGEHNLRTKEDCHPDLGCAPPPVDVAIERVIPHPDYRKDELTNDIALVRLRRSVPFSRSIRAICLPVGDEQRRTLERERVTVTGWGATEDGTGSDILLKIDLPIVPRKKCAAIYNRAVPVTEQQMCAGGLTGKDSCGGDSGGPLQFIGLALHGGLSYIQYGVVSFGPRQCGTAGRPGVYTRVGFYMDWLLDNIRSK